MKPHRFGMKTHLVLVALAVFPVTEPDEPEMIWALEKSLFTGWA